MKSICAALLCAVSVLAADREPTAFELIKEGHRYVGEQSKDQVIRIRSEKSVGTLTPKVWKILYHDPTANFKSVEVEFAAGKMIDVTRPLTFIKAAKSTGAMSPEKLKIDSDAAIAKALKEPILENLKVRSVQASLEEKENTGPVWRIKLWAEKVRNSLEIAEIGSISLTADDGTVIATDVKISRLN